MERKYIEKRTGNAIDFDTDYDCNDKPIEINVLEKFISEAKLNGASHVRITGGVGFDNQLLDVTIVAVDVRFESDKEISERILQEEETSRRNERNNLASRKRTYDKLKKEFG